VVRVRRGPHRVRTVAFQDRRLGARHPNRDVDQWISARMMSDSCVIAAEPEGPHALRDRIRPVRHLRTYAPGHGPPFSVD
jgi:hypothetical protein